jgi:hypothetical protein
LRKSVVKTEEQCGTAQKGDSPSTERALSPVHVVVWKGEVGRVSRVFWKQGNKMVVEKDISRWFSLSKVGVEFKCTLKKRSSLEKEDKVMPRVDGQLQGRQGHLMDTWERTLECDGEDQQNRREQRRPRHQRSAAINQNPFKHWSL